MRMFDYEVVIGLEVHAELLTKTKIFCSCPTTFGSPPNTQCCPVCMGLPGALPTLNRHAVELAVMAGLALDCDIRHLSRTDRKQYFYPDLPKAYQISQERAPICQNGSLMITLENGEKKRIGISRIHIEEDAGKLIHVGNRTYIDGNRCGIPLVEIVSEPVMRSAEEAVAYLKALRALLFTCGVSNCRMQEGSLRCDVNISVRRRGEETLGVRTEIKNLNSFAFVEKAIKYETERQITLLHGGEEVLSETRRYDASTGRTVRMRVKERTEDYRYLTEPDLLPIRLEDADIERLRASLPELPVDRARRMAAEYEIGESETRILVSDYGLADYFEEAAKNSNFPGILVHMLLSDLLRHCSHDPFASPVSPSRLCALCELVGRKTVNSATAKKLLTRLLTGDFSPAEVVEREGLSQIRDTKQLKLWAKEAVMALPRAVEDYRAGKKAAMNALQGRMMKESDGRADPELCEQLLLQILNREDQ